MEPLLLLFLFLTGSIKYTAAYILHHHKRPLFKRIAPCFAVACGVSILSVFESVPILYLRIMIDLMVYISIFVLMDESLREKLTIFSILVFSIESLSIFVSLLFFGFPSGPVSMMQNLVADVSAIFLLFVYALLRKIMERHERIRRTLTRLLPVMLLTEAVILLLAIGGVVYILSKGTLIGYIDTVYVLSLLGLLSIMGVIWTAVYLWRTNKLISESASCQKQYADVQMAYLQTLLQREEETKTYRHDFQKHLIYLNDLVKKGYRYEIVSYVERLQTDFTEINRHIYHTGNDVIDAVTNACSSTLPSDINIQVRGMIHDTGSLPPVDLCTIYSNLLTNAVEELNRIHSTKKELRISFFQGSSHIGIQIQNTCKDGSPLPASGVLLTTKNNPENHGFGIHSVQKCVKKHNGNVRFERNNSLFTVEVELPTAS